MKIIFLDIDGVLNSNAYLAARPEAAGCPPEGGDWSLRFDPTLVARFQTVLEASDARIVLSTSWRNDPNIVAAAAREQLSTSAYIETLLRKRGAPGAVVLDRTPDGDRGAAILAWLATAAHVQSWVAIDDAAPQYMGGAEYRTVRTDANVGLQDAQVASAIYMLGMS